jgi:hypothetical protein
VQLTHVRSVEGTTDGTRLTITIEGQTGDFFEVADPSSLASPGGSSRRL